jgi:hypothetical protein
VLDETPDIHLAPPFAVLAGSTTTNQREGGRHMSTSNGPTPIHPSSGIDEAASPDLLLRAVEIDCLTWLNAGPFPGEPGADTLWGAATASDMIARLGGVPDAYNAGAMAP